MPESNTLIVALGDVSGKGVPAALYSVFAGELVRGRTFRRRFLPGAIVAGQGADVDQHHPPRAPARGVLLHALLRVFDLKRRTVTLANSGLPYPVRVSGGEAQLIELPGVPLGSFFGVSYDEVALSAHRRRRVRVLLGRRVRGDERAAGGVHVRAPAGRRVAAPAPRPPAKSSQRIVSRRRRTPRRLPAERRHDRRRGEADFVRSISGAAGLQTGRSRGSEEPRLHSASNFLFLVVVGERGDVERNQPDSARRRRRRRAPIGPSSRHPARRRQR